MKRKNRFPALVAAIQETASVARGRVELENAAILAGQLAEMYLKRLSPHRTYPPVNTWQGPGTPEPYEGERKREPHVPISEGWQRPDVTISGTTAEVLITNVSEHLDVQRTGILTPYTETGPQLFWYPLKGGGGGRAYFLGVTRNHYFGPWGGRDFVEEAADQARPDLMEIFRESSYNVAFSALNRHFNA